MHALSGLDDWCLERRPGQGVSAVAADESDVVCVAVSGVVQFELDADLSGLLPALVFVMGFTRHDPADFALVPPAEDD